MKNSANHFFVQYKYIKIFLSVLLSIIFLHGIVFSQADENYRSKLHIEGASNIWGNTITLGYDYSISKHFYAGVSIGKGYFQYNFGDSGSFFVYHVKQGRDNIASFDFKELIDLKLGYTVKQHYGLRFFNAYEAGFSYMHLVFRDQFEDRYNYLWKGEKPYSLWSVILSVNIADYKPKDEKHLNFSMGIKNRFAVTSSPQYLVYENSLGQSFESYYQYYGGTTILWYYPELFFRINYSL